MKNPTKEIHRYICLVPILKTWINKIWKRTQKQDKYNALIYCIVMIKMDFFHYVWRSSVNKIVIKHTFATFTLLPCVVATIISAIMHLLIGIVYFHLPVERILGFLFAQKERHYIQHLHTSTDFSSNTG